MKKVLALVLALVLVFSLSVSAFAAGTTDRTEAKAKAQIKSMLSKYSVTGFNSLVDKLTKDELKALEEVQPLVESEIDYLKEELKAAKGAKAQVEKVQNAADFVSSLIEDTLDYKVVVKVSKVAVNADGTFEADATISVTTPTSTKPITGAAKIDTSKSSMSPLSAKTGDSGLIIAIVSLAAAAGVLVLAARKSRNVA